MLNACWQSAACCLHPADTYAYCVDSCNLFILLIVEEAKIITFNNPYGDSKHTFYYGSESNVWCSAIEIVLLVRHTGRTLTDDVASTISLHAMHTHSSIDGV